MLGVNVPGVITEYSSSFEEADGLLSQNDVEHDTRMLPLSFSFFFYLLFTAACDILGAWLCTVTDTYLTSVEKSLPLITSGGELKQLFEQFIQCGKQLSVKGADMRPVLQQIFSQRIMTMFSAGVDTSYKSFHLCLTNHVWMKHASHGREHKYDRVGGSTAPPQVLRQYLPLGYLCNGILNAFNEFRRCAFVALTPQVIHALSAMLRQCVADVVAVYETQSLDETELQGYLAFVKVMTDDFMSYVARSTDIMLSTSRGVSAREICLPLTEIYKQHVKPAPKPKKEAPEGDLAEGGGVVGEGVGGVAEGAEEEVEVEVATPLTPMVEEGAGEDLVHTASGVSGVESVEEV